MPQKKCTRLVKRQTEQGVKKVPCGGVLKNASSPCPNRDMHILPFKTGYCNNGWCEGIKPRTKSGNAAPSCTFYGTCPCECHDMLDKMFAMSKMERILVEKSDYAPPARTWWMPSDDPLPPLSNSGPTTAPVRVESPAPGYVPPHVAREYGPTPTGRAARGELESWVQAKCDEWLIEKYDFPCTPAWISEEIAKEQGIKPPSVGAISAVFDRWVKLGFAVIEKKPVRFTRYTPDGIWRGLEGLKVDAKRKKAMARSLARRGVR